MRITEDRIPVAGIESAVAQLERDLASRGLQCTVSWAACDAGEATVTITCEGSANASRTTRILRVVAGIIGALLFTIWPFVPGERLYGALAWIGGAMVIAAYFASLRSTSGGIAYDRLQRFAKLQRSIQ